MPRLLEHIHDSKVSNPVVVSGDIHSFFANDLKLDFDDQSSPVVATELVGTSISSYGPPYDPIAQALPDNPHVHFFDSRRRGYVVVDLCRSRCRRTCAWSPMRMIQRRQSPRLRLSPCEGGRPGIVEA